MSRFLPLLRWLQCALATAVLGALSGACVGAQVGSGDAAQDAIQAELRARGDLGELAQRWREAGPAQRLALALARGDLAAAATLCDDPALRPSHAALRARLLAVRGQFQDALVAVAAQGEPAAATAVERGEWFLWRAGLRHAAGDLDGATADLRAAVAAAALPTFTDRVGLYAGMLGLWPLALTWHTVPAAGGKAAFHAALRRGMWRERAGQDQDAAQEYQTALAAAELARDRSYALAQLCAVHRRAGTLATLAEQWLAQSRSGPPLEAEAARALIEVLRELGRAEPARVFVESLPPAARGALEGLAVELALEAGQAEVAAQGLRARLAQHPEDAALRSHLAVLLVDLHQEAAAAQLLTERAASATRKELRVLGQTATELGMDAVVKAVAAAMAQGGEPGDATDAALLEAAHLRRRQRTPAAIARLLQARATATRPADRVRLADQLESLGQSEAATALLSAVFDETGAEDLGMRLAWLLSESKKDADRQRAVAMFRKVWVSAGSPARRVQAEDHVLDLAAREGTLADLALELEAQLADPKTPNRPAVRDALIKIHARAKDTVGAVAILRQWLREEPQQEVAGLEQIARVHLAADEYRAYDRTLRQLIARNPEGEIDYRQQLAVAALERGRPELARQCIQEMIGRPGVPDLAALEFGAGIYTLAAQHEEAVKLYRRTLALHPERVETWLLLGNALRAANQRELAIGLFQSLLLQEPPDDLFVVAVDGLLNMEAPRPALLAARQIVERRLLARPDQVFLHRVRQDLLEAVGEPQARLRSIADCVVVAGEQRLSFVRELMQEAETRRDWRDYAAYGRTLLLLGDEVPPSVFVSLGEALLKNGEFDAAARAFGRARLANDFGAVEARIAELYEKAGRLVEAERMRRQILRRAPEEPAALLATARVCEQAAADARALALYLDAAKLLLPAELQRERAAPRVTPRAGASAGGITPLPVPVVLPAALPANRNREAEGPQFAEVFAACLRTAASRAELEPLCQDLLAALQRPRLTADGQLKLLQWLRHISTTYGDAALAAQVRSREDALLGGADDRTRKAIAAERLEAGDLDAALPLLQDGEAGWDLLRALVRGGDPAALQAAAARASVDLVPELARLLLLAGRRAEIEPLAARLAEQAQREPDRAGRAWVRLQQLLGLPADERALAQRQLDKALASTDPPARRVPAVLTALRAHRDLPAAERQGHLLALAVAVIEAKDQALAGRLLDDAAESLPQEQVAALIGLALADSGRRAYAITNQVKYLKHMEPARAQELLQDALRKLGAEDRRTQTLRILQLEGGNLPEPLVVALARGLDLSRLGLADRYPLMMLATREALPLAALQIIAERLRASEPEDAVTLLCGVRIAAPDARAAAAERAVLALGHKAEFESVVTAALDEILEVVPVASCDGLLAQLPERAPAQLRAALLRRAGRPLDAARQVAAAAERRPDDMSLLLQATRLLEQHAQWDAALRLFHAAQKAGSKFYPYQAAQMARLELRAGHPAAALLALQLADDPGQSNFNLALRVLAQVPDAAARQRVLRRMMQERTTRGRGLVMGSVLAGRGGDASDSLAAALAPPTLPAPVPASSDSGDDAGETGLDLLVLIPEGSALAAGLQRQPAAGRGDDLVLDRVRVGAAQRRGGGDAVVAAAVASLAQRPQDPGALRTVLAAAQLGLPVPAPALHAAVLARLDAQNPEPGAWLDAALAAQRAGDPELVQRLLAVLLADRALLRNVRLRGAVAGLLALVPADQSAALLRLAPGNGGEVDEALDSELLAALLRAEADPVAVATAWRPAVQEWLTRGRDRALTSHALRLAWCGVLAASGDAPAAVALFTGEGGRPLLVGSVPAAHLFGAAVPPPPRWRQPEQVTAFGAALVAACESGGEEKRGLTLRLLAVLVARLRTAGRNDEAAALTERVRALGRSAALPLEAWLPGA